MRTGFAVLLVSAAVAAGGAAGYVAGAGSTPGPAEARALERAARLAALPGAYTAAFADEWRDGLLAGRAEGVIKGGGEGDGAGRRAGRAAAVEAVAKRQERLREEVEAVPAPPPAAEPPPADVLVVGDSLEVLTSPYLQRHLPGVQLTISAEGGYSSPQLYELFEKAFRPEHDVVVFDAGTNDSPLYPQILAGRLQAVAERVGGRCMVVPTIHSYVVDGVGDEGKNRVVGEFAASRPGTQTPDWQSAVAEHPEYMQPDDLHPNADGADFRAALIAEGVKGCLGLSF